MEQRDVEPLPFTARDFLALFPAAPQPPETLLPRDCAPDAFDPAAELRGQDPLGVDAFLRELRSRSRLLSAQTRLALWLAALPEWFGGAVVQQFSWIALALALLVPLWVFNASLGLFDTVPLAMGTAAIVVACSMWILFIVARTDFRAWIVAGRYSAGVSLDNHVHATVVRWCQAARGAAASAEACETARELARGCGSVLGKHEEGDAFCSCARVGCAGTLARNAARLQACYAASQVINLWYILSLVWTPLFSAAYVPLTYTTWWSGTLAAAYIAVASFRAFYNSSRILLLTTAHLDLEQRIQHPSCSARATSATMIIVCSFAALQGLVFNVAGDACVPMWVLAMIAFNLRLIFVDAIVELVHYARTASAPAGAADTEEGRLARVDALASLSENAEILRAFVAGDQHRARFFGLVATMSLVRTLAVTLFTVLLGLWTIFRGAGIRFVVDVACPAVGS
ncbi:hypothetical protein DFJ74DRAFT_645073 [Hyaloraphidium curvatum]|nr:hypothetical protein DFJ74DRAFT_645073 [Hyaloraphidium curvatum]